MKTKSMVLAILVLVLVLFGCKPTGPGPARDEDLFGIYIATLDGKNVHCLISDSTRQMTHPRVSPDGALITFTRYN